MTATPPGPEILAAALAARLIHDVSGPASGVVTGLDLHATAGDPALAASGLALATDSARALLDLLDACRAAFGPTVADQSAAALHRLAAAGFAGRRATLAWTTDEAHFDGAAVRVTLLLSQIAAAGLGAGGVADLSAGRDAGGWRIRVVGRGPRAALPAEAVDGLAGRAAGEGVGGRWAPSRFLHAVAVAAGGTVTLDPVSDGFSVTVTLAASDD